MSDRLRPSNRRAGLDQRARRDGSAAIEFSMVALPFFMMLFAVMELGLIFVTDSVLENAVIESSRQIRTGQAANAGMTPAQFKTLMCGRMSAFANDCQNRASVDVRVIPKFIGYTPPDPTSSGSTFDNSKLTFNIGGPESLILVRVFYRQKLFTPFLNQSLSKLGDGNAILTATSAFRNEPYDT